MIFTRARPRGIAEVVMGSGGANRLPGRSTAMSAIRWTGRVHVMGEHCAREARTVASRCGHSHSLACAGAPPLLTVPALR